MVETQYYGDRIILHGEANEVCERDSRQRGSLSIVLPGQAEMQPLHVGR